MGNGNYWQFYRVRLFIIAIFISRLSLQQLVESFHCFLQFIATHLLIFDYFIHSQCIDLPPNIQISLFYNTLNLLNFIQIVTLNLPYIFIYFSLKIIQTINKIQQLSLHIFLSILQLQLQSRNLFIIFLFSHHNRIDITLLSQDSGLKIVDLGFYVSQLQQMLRGLVEVTSQVRLLVYVPRQ